MLFPKDLLACVLGRLRAGELFTQRFETFPLLLDEGPIPRILIRHAFSPKLLVNETRMPLRLVPLAKRVRQLDYIIAGQSLMKVQRPRSPRWRRSRKHETVIRRLKPRRPANALHWACGNQRQTCQHRFLTRPARTAERAS